MKDLLKALTVLYIVFPVFLIPLIPSGFVQPLFGNWAWLAGMACYYISILLVMAKQKIIMMIPVLFFSWFWCTFAFDWHGFIFFLFVCIFSGAGLYQLAQQVKYHIRRVLPDNKLAEEYEQKIAKMHARLNLYKQKHPTTAITPEIIDTIRDDIFFA